MSEFDTMKLAGILRDAAKAEILPRFRRLEPEMIRQKSEAIDLVTEADEQAERLIRAEVAKVWPEALFVGEESVAADAALLDRFDEAEFSIVVDPVDGTANFAAGLPLFGVMAAVVKNGETVAGIIYDPMGDDFFVAEKGAGAFMRRPDGASLRLKVAEPPELEQMVGTVSISFLPKETKPTVMANLAKVRVAAHYRVAAHEYRLFAGGNTHFVAYKKLMPWDHLGGCLMAQEAGGYVARFDGSPYLPHHRSGGLLLAADISTWNMLRAEVFTL